MTRGFEFHEIILSLRPCARPTREITGRDPEISGRQGAADARFPLNRYAEHADRDLRPRLDDSDAFKRRVRFHRRLSDFHQGHGNRICDWCGVDDR